MNNKAARRIMDMSDNIITLPILGIPKPYRPSRIQRFGIWLGVLMANPETPKGWSFNPATATLFLTVLGMVAFGGWYVGQKEAESRHLLEQIQEAKRDAAEAKKLQTYSAGVADTHKPEENKKQEQKK